MAPKGEEPGDRAACLSTGGKGGVSDRAQEASPTEHGGAAFGAEGVLVRALSKVQGCLQGAGGWGLWCHVTCM